MKPLLLLALFLASSGAGYSETYYREYRHGAPVQRSTVRTYTYTAPTAEIYGKWDRTREYMWDGRRYHWDGDTWIVLPGAVYGGGGFRSSATLQDDVGLDNTREEVYVPRTTATTTVEVDSSLTADVQRRLARRGYYHGPVDGVIGPRTRSAIAGFQDDNGMQANGVMTREVISALGL